MNALLAVVLLVANVQDTSDTRALLRLEDDWARALVRRDTAVFHRPLSPGFVYTQGDPTLTRDPALHEVGSRSETVADVPHHAKQGHRLGPTRVVTEWVV